MVDGRKKLAVVEFVAYISILKEIIFLVLF
jgi:hypothetical protein